MRNGNIETPDNGAVLVYELSWSEWNTAGLDKWVGKELDDVTQLKVVELALHRIAADQSLSGTVKDWPARMVWAAASVILGLGKSEQPGSG